jgi:hypothetical protein
MGQQSFETNDGDIITTIQDAVKTETIDVPHGHYLTREVYLPPNIEFSDALECSSLTAIVDYLNNDIDKDVRPSIIVHVVSPTEVRVSTQLKNDSDDRFNALRAVADIPHIKLLGNYQSQEDAMIELQSKFVQEGMIVDLLRSIGNVVMEEEITQGDDGVTQSVMVQSGIDRKFSEIANPVSLKPFRTFAEVEQPASPFVLRLKKTNGLQIALFDADGGKWRNEARQNIKAFLGTNLNNTYAILA